MKKILLLTALLTGFYVSAQQKYEVVFKNVNLVPMNTNRVIENQNIAINDGKIVLIENATKSKLKGKVEYDLKGKYIMPSLADAHVHFPDKLEDMPRYLDMNIVNGVTKLRSMRGNWDHPQWKQEIENKKLYYPKLYLSAPTISRNQIFSDGDAEKFVSKTKELGFDFIKILSIKDLETFEKLDKFCKELKLPLSGHFPRLASGNYLPEEVFFQSNYNCIEHLGGLAGEKDLFDSRIEAIINHNIYICPTLSWYSIGSGQYPLEEIQNLPGMKYVSSRVMDEWISKTKEYQEKIGATALKEEIESELKTLEEKFNIIKILQEKGIKMLLSPDASGKYMMPGFDMVYEMELLQKADLSNFEILQMATSNFADFFNGNYGVIDKEKDADFIVLDANPLEDLSTLKNIKGVYYNQVFLDEKKLEEIKSSLKPN